MTPPLTHLRINVTVASGDVDIVWREVLFPQGHVLAVQGVAPHDAADTGNPIKIGGIAAADIENQTDVGVGDRVNAKFSRKGALLASVWNNAGSDGQDAKSNSNGITQYLDSADVARALIVNTWPSGYDAAPGLGVLAVGPRSPGASEVKTLYTSHSSSTKAIKIDPTSGKKVRMISVQCGTTHATATNFEVFFGDIANIADATGDHVAILKIPFPATIGERYSIVWPDGAGPVGIADSVVCVRCDGAVTDPILITLQYREE
jgi:hypothetical protein